MHGVRGVQCTRQVPSPELVCCSGACRDGALALGRSRKRSCKLPAGRLGTEVAEGHGMHVTPSAHFETPSARHSAPQVELEGARLQREDLPRPWLRHAARSLRSNGLQASLVSESPWQHIVSGRWSPVDSFEDGGALFVVAQRTATELQVTKALTRREQEVLARAARGYASKCIAYELEISQSQVSLIMAQARQKLNVRSAAELLRLLWVLRASDSGESDTSTDYWASDRQEYVTFSRSQPVTAIVATLTRSERMVFQAIIAGLSTTEISASRGSSPRTLANQLASIFGKLHVGSRAELRVRFAHCYREATNRGINGLDAQPTRSLALGD